MSELIKAILFGIVEGITEWLPVSSTGHMILLNEFVRLEVSDAFMEMFLVVIQLGAILAVVLLFWKRLWPFGKSTEPAGEKGILRYCKKSIWQLWLKVLAACLPAAVVGVLLDDFFESLFYNAPCVAGALIIFGVGFIVIENRNKGKQPRITSTGEIDYKTALIIGVFQLIAAIFPGTSRSGATILGALMIGVSRTVAAEFTFFLAVPVMLGASLLKVLKFGLSFSGTELLILFSGMLVAFLVSVLVIRFLMDYIKRHDFKIFGWYRIVLGILVLLYFGLLK